MSNLTKFKLALMNACRDAVEQRIANAEKAMLSAQESANSEEKSSAGDKYETGRAMSQIERDRNAKQLAEAKNELAQLNKIDLNIEHQQAGTGALVVCAEDTFFIAAAVGVITVNKQKAIVLSPKAPLTQELLGKKAGDRITFNGRMLTIKSIC